MVKCMYVCKRIIVVKFGDTSCFNNIDATEFEYNFTCTCKNIQLCFIVSPGKILAVLEL